MLSPCLLLGRNKEKEKGIIAYNTLYGIGVMKIHVESKHLELLTIFVEKVVIVDNISRSQITSANEGCRAMEVAKKHSKVVLGVILAFSRSKTLCKKLNEAQQLFQEDLIMFTTKGFFPLSSCENIWM
jgi:hypothetical protein